MSPGCAFPGGCDDSVANGGAGCHLCDVIAKLPQPRRLLEDAKPAANATRDGEPKLSGEKKRGNPAFESGAVSARTAR